MTKNELKNLVKEIVSASKCLNDTHTNEVNAEVNYACIFSQNLTEFEELLKVTKELGAVVHETKTGPLFLISPLATDAGMLRILKIRLPDPKRKEKGDADFTVNNYNKFKSSVLSKAGFNIIKRTEMEMIELINPCYNVIAYYSNPIIADVLNIKLD